jgi:CBS-domain-containing membrane protein
MIVVGATACTMGLVMRPLNAIHPPLLAAVLSIVVGGAILASSVLAFDVGGLRALVAKRLRWLRFAPRF